MTISTRRFCGSRTPSAVCTSGWALAAADDRDRRRRHAVAHQRILDRVRATQRQRHVVGFRPRLVGVAGRRDAGAALGLVGAGGLPDRVQRAWADRFERSQSKNTMKDGGGGSGRRRRGSGRRPVARTCIGAPSISEMLVLL